MRRTVTKEIKSDPTACEDLFLVILQSHVIAAAMKEFNFDSMEDMPPSSSLFGSKSFQEGTRTSRREVLVEASKKLVEKYTYKIELEKKPKENDHVLAYGKELMSLGLLYLEYRDSIREADGNRILRCWKYILFIFKANTV